MARTSYRVRFAGGSGYELAGIIDRPDDARAFPVAVMSHCFTCNKDLKAIVRISRGLAVRGIGVLRFDMTGLGGSQGDFSRTNFTTNLRDLRAAIRFAQSELGQANAVIGHSFGGAAALAIAADPDSGVAPQVVVTLAAPSDTHHLAKLLAKMDPSIESTGSGEVSIGGRTYPILKQMLDDFHAHDLTSMIPRIQASTLLLHSPVDQTVHFDHALRIMGLIQNSPQSDTSVSLVSLEGADHLLAEKPEDIEFIVATTAAFIRRRVGSGE